MIYDTARAVTLYSPPSDEIVYPWESRVVLASFLNMATHPWFLRFCRIPLIDFIKIQAGVFFSYVFTKKYIACDILHNAVHLSTELSQPMPPAPSEGSRIVSGRLLCQFSMHAFLFQLWLFVKVIATVFPTYIHAQHPSDIASSVNKVPSKHFDTAIICTQSTLWHKRALAFLSSVLCFVLIVFSSLLVASVWTPVILHRNSSRGQSSCS